jgi:hypothetical protein
MSAEEASNSNAAAQQNKASEQAGSNAVPTDALDVQASDLDAKGAGTDVNQLNIARESIAEVFEAPTPTPAPERAGATAAQTTSNAHSFADPWQTLAQLGTQLIGALNVAQNPETASHPWVERSSSKGPAHLKIPLPKPETMRQLADAFAQFAQHLGALGEHK